MPACLLASFFISRWQHCFPRNARPATDDLGDVFFVHLCSVSHVHRSSEATTQPLELAMQVSQAVDEVEDDSDARQIYAKILS
jgi:hypothetical protein